MNAATARHADPAGFAVAALLLATAGLIVLDASRLQISSTYGVGPKAMPFVVAAGLVPLAIANAVMAWRTDFPAREEADPKAIILILGGLAALIALIGLGGGFIPGTAILFAATTSAFGRRAFVTDLVIGAALGLAIFFVFEKLLTLSLPAGPIENLLR